MEKDMYIHMYISLIDGKTIIRNAETKLNQSIPK